VLAVDRANATGGVRGTSIQLKLADDRSIQTEATRAVSELVHAKGAVALLGDIASSRSVAGALVANSLRTPMITPSATAPEVTLGRPFVFRACTADDTMAEILAQLAVRRMRKNALAVLFSAQDSYSRTVADGFVAAANALGAHVVVSKSYSMGETNFAPHLADIARARPELVLTPVYFNEMVTIARQGAKAGLKGSQFLGADGWDAPELLDAAAELEGATYVTHFAADSPVPASRMFVEVFAERYHRVPDALAALGYDSARMLIAAMEHAKSASSEDIRDALARTRDFVGVSGPVTIGPGNITRRPLAAVRITGGKVLYASEAP
jgi:branched-chain amino acid transport system substrate-binding protein